MIDLEIFNEISGFIHSFKEVELFTYNNEGMLIENLDNPYAKRIAEGILVPMIKVDHWFFAIKYPVTNLILSGPIKTL